MFTIIEDCSPYYIRFTHSNTKQIVSICQSELTNSAFTNGFTHHVLNKHVTQQILQLDPLAKNLVLNLNRVSLFVTQPGYYYRAHKDGKENRMSINYTVQILDDKCTTNWYDNAVDQYPLDLLDNRSREAMGFDKSQHTPLKSMTAQQDECILFNTDIWHDFDNSQSLNTRAVLTLRSVYPGKFYFEDVKEMLYVQ